MKNVNVLKERIRKKKVFAGFDGYIDLLYSVVEGETGGEKEVFKESGEFVENLIRTSGMSSEYEILLKERRIGGNAPLMSIGMASMGADVCCAGLFGENGEDLNLNVYSLGEPAVTIALEFQDCKYMLADRRGMETVTYENLVHTMGEDAIQDKILQADLIAAVNWSAMPGLTEILEHLLDGDVQKQTEKKRWLYLDLSDIRARSAEQVKDYFRVIKKIAVYAGFSTCLSVNQNELEILEDRYKIYGEKKEKLQKLRNCLQIDELIYHGMSEAVFCTKEILEKTKKQVFKDPVLTTGAGDNFNAGVCIGKLLDLSPKEQLEIGNRAAEFYVCHGCSAKLEDVLN